MFAKVVMAITNGDLVMLVLPAPSMVDVDKVAEVVGEDVRLSSESEFATTFADCEAGAMPPFGNLYDLACTSTSRSAGTSGSCSRPERTA
jgi:Ala-tRNA(Pro) deacylase